MSHLILWPKGLRVKKTAWERIHPDRNEIRATFNADHYLKYLRAINAPIKTPTK